MKVLSVTWNGDHDECTVSYEVGEATKTKVLSGRAALDFVNGVVPPDKALGVNLEKKMRDTDLVMFSRSKKELIQLAEGEGVQDHKLWNMSKKEIAEIIIAVRSKNES